ncbi:MAG: hemerythrin domain-containing protein [Chitinophagales bacterium]
MAESIRNEFVMQGSFFAHRALMRDTEMLLAISRQIDSLSRDEILHFRNWYEFYWTMMEQHHTTEDDILFLEIEKRLHRPSETIEGMEVEHNRLQFLIDEIRRLIGEAVRAEESLSAIKSDLKKYAAELLQLFSHHIREEEKYVYEKMTTLFTPQEQRRIEERVKRKAPVKYLSYMIPWLQDSLSSEEKKDFDGSLPLSVRAFNYLFWKEKYARIASPVKQLASNLRAMKKETEQSS